MRLLATRLGLLIALTTACQAYAEPIVIGGQVTDAKYLESRPPRRLALVVGNDDYRFLGDLPGVQADVASVAQKFVDMGFDEVVTARNVKDSSTFQHDVLVPFRKKVERDDLVVVYFSGHGFAYLGNQYFVLADMLRQVPQAQLTNAAVPVESLIGFFEAESPGALLLIVDACRTPADFVLQATDGTDLPKGSNDGRDKSQTLNYILALAVDRGLPSIASSNPATMSVYSGALVQELGRDEDFRLLHDAVEFDVSMETNSAQVPGLYEFSMTDVVLSLSSSREAQEQERWLSILSTGDPAAVRKFVAMKTLSPFVRAARLWLSDNENRAVAETAPVSPSAVEEGWDAGRNLVALSSPLKFPRYEARTYTIPPSGDPQLTFDQVLRANGLKVDAPGERVLDSLTIADWIDGLKGKSDIVVNGEVGRFSLPDFRGSPKFPDFPVSANVVDVFVPSRTDTPMGGQFWASVADTNGQLSFVPISPINITELSIGIPTAEVSLRPLADGVSGLVDVEPLKEAVKAIRDSGHTVSWVSIAAALPEPSERAAVEAADAEFMVANVQYNLARIGVDRTLVTAVTDDLSVHPGTIRVRLFAQ